MRQTARPPPSPAGYDRPAVAAARTRRTSWRGRRQPGLAPTLWRVSRYSGPGFPSPDDPRPVPGPPRGPPATRSVNLFRLLGLLRSLGPLRPIATHSRPQPIPSFGLRSVIFFWTLRIGDRRSLPDAANSGALLGHRRSHGRDRLPRVVQDPHALEAARSSATVNRRRYIRALTSAPIDRGVVGVGRGVWIAVGRHDTDSSCEHEVQGCPCWLSHAPRASPTARTAT